MTNDQLLDQYQTWFEHNLGRAGSSVDHYLRFLKRLAKYLNAHGKTLAQADRADLEHFSGPLAHQDGLKPASRRPLIAALRSFYGYLERQEIIQANTANLLVYPKAGKPLPTTISRHHAEQLLMDCDLSEFIGVRDAAILALLLATGMRVSGLSGLNQEQIYSVASEEEGKEPIPVVKVLEKGKKERILPLPAEAAMYVRIYLNHPKMLRLKKDLLLEDGQHVMFAQFNRGSCAAHEWFGERRRLSSKGVERVIERRGTRLNIPREQLHPHAFRHLFGTEMVESGTDLVQVKSLMGHSNMETTAIYVHMAMGTKSQSVNTGSPLSKMNTPMHQIRMEELKAKAKASRKTRT